MKNKKSNTIFNKGLYVEGIKQLKSLGFIFLGLSLFITLVTIFGKVNDIESYYSNMKDRLPQTIEVMREYGAMRLVYVFVAPIMTISLFSFLTKRNACDYYHAFPQTRTCLLFSYMASVATWLIAIIWGTIGTSLLVYTIYDNYFTISVKTTLHFGLVITICSLLVMAAVVLASTLTGTIFTNIVGTGLILFLPRALIAYCVSIITARYDIFESNGLLPILDFKNNLLIGNIIDLVNYSDEFYSFDLSALTYTIILMLVYIGLAVLFINKRNSETAGKSATGKKLQAGIRVCIGLIVSLLPLTGIIEMHYYDRTNFYDSDMFYIVVYYMIAIIVMMIYEVLSTKNIRNIKKVLSSTILLAIANVVLFFTIMGIGSSQLNYCPEVSDVDYVKISTDYNRYYSRSDDYFEAMSYQIKFTDKEIISLVREILEENINICSKGSIREYIYANDLNEGYKNFKVTIKSGLFEKTRILYVKTTKYNELLKLVNTNEKYKQIRTHLPIFDSNIKLAETWYMCAGSNKLDLIKLYESLRKEVIELDDPTAYKTGDTMYPGLKYTMTLNYEYKSHYSYADLTISHDKTPKTYDLYVKMLNKLMTKEYGQKISSLYADIPNASYQLRNLDISIISVDGKMQNDVINYVSSASKNYDEALLAELVAAGIDENIDTSANISGKKLCLVQLNYTQKNDELDVMYFAYIDETLLTENRFADMYE